MATTIKVRRPVRAETRKMLRRPAPKAARREELRQHKAEGEHRKEVRPPPEASLALPAARRGPADREVPRPELEVPHLGLADRRPEALVDRRLEVPDLADQTSS